jgi:CRP-like cAMP-binding protein
MSLDDDIRVLSKVSLFDGFTQEQLRLLAFGSENARLPAGKEIYREGAPADSAYVVAKGRVNLTRDRNGEQVVVSSVGPGAILGEFALISSTHRLTGAVAATDAEIMRLNRKLFRRILEEYPDAALALQRRITEDLQSLISQIERLAPKFS